jgi:hypothetical protein
MPREEVRINLSTLPAYEAGAVFMAWLAHPGADEGDRRARLHSALCRETILETAAEDEELASQPQAIRPLYFKMNDAVARAVLKAGYKELTRRMIAAEYYALPFVKQLQMGHPLKVDGFDLSVRALARRAQNDFSNGEGDSEGNFIHRYFALSKPVIHAAVALQECLQIWSGHSPEKPFNLGYFLHEKRLIIAVVERSEQYRLFLPSVKTPPIVDEPETIKFELC